MKIKTILLAGMLMHAAPYFAVSAPMTYQNDRFSISGSWGYLGGKANEYVYTWDNEKLSELNWKIKNASVVKGEMNYDFLPWLTANVNGWTTLGQGKAVMDDYDWLYEHQSHWSHWSHSPDTSLKRAHDLDFNLRTWLLKYSQSKLGVLVGYEQNAFQFLAKGGCYQYDNGADVGCFSQGVPGIGYQQHFDTTYFGLVEDFHTPDFAVTAIVKYSPFVLSQDKDIHYMRDLTFYERGNHAQYYSASLTVGKPITQTLSLFVEGTWNQYSNSKADIEMKDNQTGWKTYFEDAAGLSNKNYVLSLGIRYRPNWG